MKPLMPTGSSTGLITLTYNVCVHFVMILLCSPTGFTSLQLSDQMNLLQMTWLDVMCLNLGYRSTPYRGLLVFADDYKNSEEQTEKYGTSSQLDTVTRRLSKKMTELSITRDEYVLLKAMVLLNPGKFF